MFKVVFGLCLFSLFSYGVSVTFGDIDIKSYKMSCNRGGAESCFSLEEYYKKNGENGESEKYHDLGIKLTDKACTMGNASSCLFMAKNTTDDKIVSSEYYLKSKKILEKSCRNGDQKSCHILADEAFGEDKLNDANNPAQLKSISIYTTSCRNGNSDSCYALGEIYKDLKDKNVQTDEYAIKSVEFYKMAFSLYDKKCRMDDSISCLTSGKMLVDGKISGIVNPTVLANEYFFKSLRINDVLCRKKLANACYDNAIIYEDGKYIPADTEKSSYYYEKSCNYGMKEGCSKIKKGVIE